MSDYRLLSWALMSIPEEMNSFSPTEENQLNTTEIESDHNEEIVQSKVETTKEKIGIQWCIDKKPSPQTYIFLVNIGLKVAAILSLIFGMDFSAKSTIVSWFIYSIFALSDFWFVKKIAFRTIVGINYSCKTDTNGDHIWTFEKLEDHQPSKAMKFSFWMVEFSFIIFLSLMALVNFILLFEGWFVLLSLTSIAFSINAYLMNKCDNTFEKTIKQQTVDLLENHIIPSINESISETNNENEGFQATPQTV